MKGTMLASWESVRIALTGRRQGYCLQFEMWDRKGKIDGLYWTLETNIIRQRTK
jgi:hypothetical protein